VDLVVSIEVATQLRCCFTVLNSVALVRERTIWLQIQRSRVRFPALPDFLSSSGSGTGSTQPREPREVNWGAT
jgi:hypothetical protein